MRFCRPSSLVIRLLCKEMFGRVIYLWFNKVIISSLHNTWMLKIVRLCNPSRFWSLVILLVPRNKLCKDVRPSRFSITCKQRRQQFIRVVFRAPSALPKALQLYPDAIWAQLQHLQTLEVVQVGNAADFVVKQKKFLQTGELLQPFHLPQNVEGNIKLPVIKQTFLQRQHPLQTLQISNRLQPHKTA